jgi:hypothetical protein
MPHGFLLSVIVHIGSHIYAWAGLNRDSPVYASPNSWDDRHEPLCPALLRWGLGNFVPGLALNHGPPNPHLSS